MKTKKLRTRILMSFFWVIAIFAVSIAILGFYIIKKDIIERAQTRVKNDLNSARQIYNEKIDNLKDVIRFTALRFFIKDAISADDREQLKKELEAIRKSESLDILTLADANGRVIIRARNPSVTGESQADNQFVSRVLSYPQVVAGTATIPGEQLLKEGPDLAEQAYIKVIPTPKAKPTPEIEQTSGMMTMAAAPVFSYDGGLVGVLYGGNLLNKNYEIVDKVRETVYQGIKYKGKDIGTATIFQGDLRISTNVARADGSRAIGTRVSEQVYDQVLIKGIPWVDRAFVVDNWYQSAYEPIRNIKGEIIGILYVGTLEKPYVDMARNIFLVFLLIVSIATFLASILALILSRFISRPITNLLKATKELSEGELGYKVDVKTGTSELDILATSCNDMSSRLNERENSLKISNEKLAALNKTYLDLVSFVSHELKGVLGSTIVNAYSIMDGFLGEINTKQKQAIEAVTRNLDYLAEIVRKFFNLSRIEKGELELNLTEVFLWEEVFEPSLDTFSTKAAEKQMEVINNIQPHLKIRCDIDLMHIVANNLIDNAIKYGLEKGKIVLNAREVGDKVQIEVYNDSIPIQKEEKDRLFKKFSRLDMPDKKEIRGTGLGLFIAREIITKHRGDIWIETSNNGNSFIFQINKDTINSQ